MGHQSHQNEEWSDEQGFDQADIEDYERFQETLKNMEGQENLRRPMRYTHSGTPLYSPYAQQTSTLRSLINGKEPAETQKATIGRPKSRGNSNTNMARYARAYREAKKKETKQFEERCKDLEREIEGMASSIKKLEEENDCLMEENMMLKKVIQHDSKLAPILARVTGQGYGSSIESVPPGVGLCVHVGGNGPTIEFCKRCNNSATSMQLTPLEPAAPKGCQEDPMFPVTDLFGGDFSAIEPYL